MNRTAETTLSDRREHRVTVVQHGRLAGRDGALRLIEAYKSFIFKSSSACSLFGIIGKASCELIYQSANSGVER